MLKQLSAQDAQFLYTQTANNLTHIMGIYIYDPSTAPGGFVRFKDIIAHVQSRVDTSPLFKRRLHRLPLDLDHPYWVEDEHFDIEAHMSHARLPEPGDWRQFCIAVARYFSKPMDMNRPLWDIYIIEGLDRIPGIPKGSFAMLHRVHHAAVDGASGAHAFIAMSDIDAKGTPAIPDAPVEDLGRAPSSAEVATRAWTASMQSPVKFMNALLKVSPSLMTAARKSMLSDQGMTAGVPETRFNAPVGPHKMFDATRVALADIAKVRAKVPGAPRGDPRLYGGGKGGKGGRQRPDHDRPVAAYSGRDDGGGRAHPDERAVRGARHQSFYLERAGRAGSALSRGRAARAAIWRGPARQQYGAVHRDAQL